MAEANDSLVENAAYQAWLLRAAYAEKTATDVGRAVKAVYVEISASQMAQVLKHNSAESVFPDLQPSEMAAILIRPDICGATSTDIAQALHSPNLYPDLTASQMGELLKGASIFPGITEAEMRTALRAAAYSQPDIDAAISRLFPARDSFLLSFDGASTFVSLSKNNYDQMDFRDSGHQNQLVDLANTGFTIDVSVYPEALDDRPIVTLIYDGDGGSGAVQWKAGDLTVGLSLYGGRIRVAAFTSDWNAGMPFDPRLVTLTTVASVPVAAWSNITVVWQYGGLAGIYLNGQPQKIEIQNNHPPYDAYNRNNFDGLIAYVCTFIPAMHRFIFGKYKERFFKGYMKNIRICTGARSASDIQQQTYNLLAGYWPLNEGSGNIAHDSTEVQNNGNIQNPLWVKSPA